MNREQQRAKPIEYTVADVAVSSLSISTPNDDIARTPNITADKVDENRTSSSVVDTKEM